MAMARPRSRVFERPSSKQRAITPSSKEMTPAQKEKEKELMARVGSASEAVKGCCGTHIYAHQKATAINLLLHHDWLCELRHAMRPRRTHLGFTADAFAHMRQRDSLLDSPPKNPPPVEEAWRPGTAPRFLGREHRVASCGAARPVAEGEPPDDWPQFCKAFCITIKEGTRAQHLRLLFDVRRRRRPESEARAGAQIHGSASNEERNGEARHAPARRRSRRPSQWRRPDCGRVEAARAVTRVERKVGRRGRRCRSACDGDADVGVMAEGELEARARGGSRRRRSA